MERVFQIADFKQFNGFYKRPSCRVILLHLYKGMCQSCQTPVDGDDYHAAHIIPRSHPRLMEKYYPGLDIDNLLNLRLSCPTCNLKESNFVLDALPLHAHFTRSARVISQRLGAVMTKLDSQEKPLEISAVDPKICTSVLHLNMEALSEISSTWHGAIVLSLDQLEQHIRQAMMDAFECNAQDMSVMQTMDEMLLYCKDYFRVHGTSMRWASTRRPAWWRKAYAIVHLPLAEESPDAVRMLEKARSMAMQDGLYLDTDELIGQEGLWIPLRTDSQRWFYTAIRTLITIQRKLADQTDSRRYVVLSEGDWRRLCDCFEMLVHVQSGLGLGSKRLNQLDVAAHFAVSNGQLYLHEDGRAFPEEVKRLCKEAGNTTLWGDGVVMSRAKLRAWLSQAFNLADLGTQNVTQPMLVRVQDARSRYSWVPSLPYTRGMTREQVRQDVETTSSTRSKRGKKSAHKEPICHSSALR